MKDKSYKAKIIKEQKANDKKQVEIYDIFYDIAIREFQEEIENFVYKVNDSVLRNMTITTGEANLYLTKYLSFYINNTGLATTTPVQAVDKVLHLDTIRDEFIKRRIHNLVNGVISDIKSD